MRYFAISLIVVFSMILVTCSLFKPDEDEAGPEMVVTAPEHLETVAEIVTVTITATDESGVAGTELYIDDMATGIIDTTEPYSFEWNTTAYTDDTEHMIYVEGWDTEGNYSNSDTVVVTVNNAVVHPSPIETIAIDYQPIGYHLSWMQSQHERFVSYTVLRSEYSNMDSALTLHTTTVVDDTTHFDSLANPLMDYYYQVQVTDSTDFISVGSIIQSPSSMIFLPNGLAATKGDTTIRLRWEDQSEFEENFVIFRDAGEGYELYATVDANLTSFIDDQLSYDIEYRYKIAISYQGVIAGLSNFARLLSPLLFAPSNLGAASTAYTIELRWDDNCIFEDGFRLERDAGLGWVQIAELGMNVTSYIDSLLAYDIYYRYRVAAFTEEMQSSYDTYFSIYSPLIFAPTNLAARSDDTTIVLTWLDRSTFESGFIIERGEGSFSNVESGYVVIDSVEADVVTYTDNQLEEDKWYWYRVAAYTPDERSGYTTTSSINSPITFAPSNMSATALDTSILLRWVDNCIFEDGFVLERDSGPGWEVIDTPGEDITGFTDTDMAYGINYTYRVAAIADGVMSDYSYPVSRYSPLQFAPTSLSVDQVGDGIQLVWNDNCIFEEGFVVLREGVADYELIATLGPNETSYFDEDMEYDIIYRYRVAAFVDPENPSAYATSYTIRSPLSYAPTDLAATSTDTSITLYWQDDCLFEEGFIIERNSGAGYLQIGFSNSNVTSFTDTSLAEGEYYYYRVAAYSTTAEPQVSGYSYSVGISSPIVFAPQSLWAATVENSIIIRWLDYCSFEDGFRVERDEGSGFVLLATLGEDATSYTDDAMEYGVLYRYRVCAFDGSELSNYSNIADRTSPLSFSPSALFAYTSSTSIDLTWQDNCIFEDGFRVERDQGAGFVGIDSVGPDVANYSDTDLVEGQIYRYRVIAFTENLESGYTSIITVESPLAFAPVNFSATAQGESIDLSWTDNCTFEEGFIVERDGGAGFVEIADLGANFTFYSDEDLDYYTIYRYRVAAYTATDQSSYTSIATVQSPMELTPSNLVANSYDTEIQLEWQDNSQVEEGFRIERNSGSGWSQIAETGEDETTYTDYDLNYGTEYTYRVKGFSNGQESDYTNEATGTIAWLYAEWDTIDAGDYTIGHENVPSGVFVHTIAADFEMMRYEVTNAQYLAYLEEALVAGDITSVDDGFQDNVSGELIINLTMTGQRILWDGSQFTITEDYNWHPVTGVTWYGADAFATHYDWALPTEEEWEVAARGVTQADYPWGNNDPTCSLANFSGCTDELIEVGQTTGVSPFGIYDMVGNAWEWTDSDYDGGTSYVLRGGSWSNYTDNLKVWYRTEGDPAATYSSIGFRCVRDLP